MSATASVFEEKPRWPGAPLICLHENLLAFDEEKDCGKYTERYCPSCSVYFKWKCIVCKKYHFLATESAPAGHTSGSKRATKMIIPRHVQDALKKAGTVKVVKEADGTQVIFFPIIFEGVAESKEQIKAEELLMAVKFGTDIYKMEAPQRWRISKQKLTV